MSHWDFSRRPDTERGAASAEPAGPADEPDPPPDTPDTWDAPGEAPAVPTARRGENPWAAPERLPGRGTPPWVPGSAGMGQPFDVAYDDIDRDAWDAASSGDGGDAWGDAASGGDSGDAWDDGDDEDDALYPVTWERDFPAAAPEPEPTPEAPPPAMSREPWPPAPYAEAPRAPRGADGPSGAVGFADSGGSGSAGNPGSATGTRSGWGAPNGWDQNAGTQAGGVAGWSQDAGSRPGAASVPSNGWEAGFAALGRPGAAGTGPGWPAVHGSGGAWDGGETQYAGRRHRHWLVLAGVIVAGAAVGVAAVQLVGRHPASGSAQGSQAGRVSATPSGAPSHASATPGARAGTATPAAAVPLTLEQAKAVLAAYTAANNKANAQRSDALLATAETGSSYAIDAGSYLFDQGTAPFPAFGPAQATYYIPSGEPAAGPRWFVAQVGNAFTSNPAKVTSNEYLLFTQQAPGGPWLNAAEPFLLPGASSPKIAVGADGLVTAVSLHDADAVAPGQLPAVTAASLDESGTAGTGGQATITPPGNLADLSDLKFWQGKLPDGTVTDTHAPATGTAGQEFALRTVDGGALVFYADAAQLTITPPAGTTLHLSITGFYSPTQALSRAGVTYLEQFAAYDPPVGGKAPTIVADYSGITGKD